MSLSKKQRKFLKTIENPKERKNQKQQFKLQNKFDSGILFEVPEHLSDFFTQHPMCGFLFVEENSNTPFNNWYEKQKEEATERFDELMNKFCPKDIKQNSLTKESLRDLTEPKARNELYSIPVLYTFEDLTLKEINVAIYDSLFSGNSIDLSFYELFKIRKEKLIAPEKEEILRKTDKQDIPKDFCVEITEENKEVLEKLYETKNKAYIKFYIGRYLLTDSLFTYLDYKSSASNGFRLFLTVSTEEFLRYIGEDNLIRLGIVPLISDKLFDLGYKSVKSVSEKTHKQNMLEKEINEYFNIMIDEVNNGNDYSPLLQLIEICCKKLLYLSNTVLAVEKMNKTTEPKPLDFDLPKKEEYVPEKEYQNAVINFIDILKRQKQESGGITHGGYEIHFQNVEIGRPFLSKIKEYTIEDMEKCFHEARKLKNNLCIADSPPSFFKHPNLKDFLESKK